MNIGDGNCMMHSDYARLMQVFINMIQNSIKFTFKGQVSIVVQQDGQNPNIIQIQINDTGIGIKQSMLSQIFEMYGTSKSN